MKHSLSLKVICGLLILNAALQCCRLRGLAQDVGKLQEAQRQDRARWDEWERVGKAKVAAGSKTTFVPDPIGSEWLHRQLTCTQGSIVLAVLIVTVSIASGIGLLNRRRWAYKLAIVYAGIAVAYGIFELMPVPSVINYDIYYLRNWERAAFILAKGLVLHGLMLYCLLRPSVRAQFARNAPTR